MPHIHVLSSHYEKKAVPRAAHSDTRLSPVKAKTGLTHWVGVVGRLPAALCSAHDDCVCRGSPAECFEIPFLVTLSKRKGLALSILRFTDSVVSPRYVY